MNSASHTFGTSPEHQTWAALPGRPRWRRWRHRETQPRRVEEFGQVSGRAVTMGSLTLPPPALLEQSLPFLLTGAASGRLFQAHLRHPPALFSLLVFALFSLSFSFRVPLLGTRAPIPLCSHSFRPPARSSSLSCLIPASLALLCFSTSHPFSHPFSPLYCPPCPLCCFWFIHTFIHLFTQQTAVCVLPPAERWAVEQIRRGLRPERALGPLVLSPAPRTVWHTVSTR